MNSVRSITRIPASGPAGFGILQFLPQARAKPNDRQKNHHGGTENTEQWNGALKARNKILRALRVSVVILPFYSRRPSRHEP